MSSSSSPEWEILPTKPKGKSKETRVKKPKTSKLLSGTRVKNERRHPRWKYEPPPDVELVEHDIDTCEFDWDKVEGDEDVELWLIRIPDGVKPKYLENVKIECSSSPKSQRVGILERKYATYDIWSVGSGETDDQPIGGEEITGLSCLLPRKNKKGKLYQAPRPIARRIVVSAQAVSATQNPTAEADSSAASLHKSVPRQIYPTERLKHRFIPYGAQVLYNDDDDDETDTMDVDVGKKIHRKDQGRGEPPEKFANALELEKTTRKRKGGGESDVKPKKPKKTR